MANIPNSNDRLRRTQDENDLQASQGIDSEPFASREPGDGRENRYVSIAPGATTPPRLTSTSQEVRNAGHASRKSSRPHPGMALKAC